MINLGISLFDLARKQLEGKKIKFTPLDVINRAIEIRGKLDDKEKQKRNKINKKHYLKMIKTRN